MAKGRPLLHDGGGRRRCWVRVGPRARVPVQGGVSGAGQARDGLLKMEDGAAGLGKWVLLVRVWVNGSREWASFNHNALNGSPLNLARSEITDDAGDPTPRPPVLGQPVAPAGFFRVCCKRWTLCRGLLHSQPQTPRTRSESSLLCPTHATRTTCLIHKQPQRRWRQWLRKVQARHPSECLVGRHKSPGRNPVVPGAVPSECCSSFRCPQRPCWRVRRPQKLCRLSHRGELSGRCR